MSERLLRRYVRLVTEVGNDPRVASQLMEPEDEEEKAQGQELPADKEKDEGELEEFSSVGGGNIVGYTLPLGMDPDAAGRRKNAPPKRRKRSKK